MPLFRIETRPKPNDPQGANPGKKPAPSERPARSTAPKARRTPDQASGRSGLTPALVAGGLVGLVIIAGLSAYFIARSRNPAAPVNTAASTGATPAAPGGSGAPAAGAAVAPGGSAAAGAAAAGAGDPAAAPLWPGPINADYARDVVIAYINGEPYPMAQLETAVRVARALGALSGDAAPAYDDPAILNYQVRILKRQIDMVLLRQAALREGLVAPTGPVDDLITSFLQRLGASDAQLDRELAVNSVTRADLQKWFEDSRTSNFYIQTRLMDGVDQSAREATVRDWLTEEWERTQAQNQLLINFYDPDQLQSQPGTSDGSGGSTAPAGSTTAPGGAAPVGTTPAPGGTAP